MDKLEDKKELIRQAAIKVMSKQGFYNTKASQVADEAGVAVGTIYNYFNNKEAILDYIFAVELEKRISFLEEIQQKDQYSGFWDKLSLFLERHFLDIKENIAVGEILVREKEFPKKNGSESINKYLNKIPAKLEALLEEAKKEGEIKSNINTTVTASIIFGGIQGVVEKAINNDLDLLNDASRQMIDLLKAGIAES